MSLDTTAIIHALTSDAKQLGVFAKVNGSEPRNAPGKGMYLTYRLDRVRPARSSGLSSTSVLVVVAARIQSPLLAEPQDQVDPGISKALDRLINRYATGFTLGGLIRAVDIRGMEGIALEGRYAYIEQDRRQFRTFELAIPMIVNDVWDETA